MAEKSMSTELGSNFWTQYISVILIVLVFTIGSFVIRHIQVKQLVALASTNPSTSVIQSERKIGEIHLKDLFSSDDEIQTPASLVPIVTVLRTHDIEGEFTISKGHSLKSVVSKIEALEKILIGADIPRAGFRIYATEDGVNSSDLRLRLTRGQ